MLQATAAYEMPSRIVEEREKWSWIYIRNQINTKI